MKSAHTLAFKFTIAIRYNDCRQRDKKRVFFPTVIATKKRIQPYLFPNPAITLSGNFVTTTRMIMLKRSTEISTVLTMALALAHDKTAKVMGDWQAACEKARDTDIISIQTNMIQTAQG